MMQNFNATRKGIQLLNKQRKTFNSFCKDCRNIITYEIAAKMQLQGQSKDQVVETSDRAFYDKLLCPACREIYHRSLE